MNLKQSFEFLFLSKETNQELWRRKTVLKIISATIALAVLIGFVGVAFVFTEKQITSLALGILLAIAITTFVLANAGRVDLASGLLMTTLWLLTTGLVSVSGGMRSLHLTFYISGAALAGLLLGRVGAVIFGGASILAGGGLLAIENAGVSLPEPFSFPAASGWFILVINLMILVPAINITLGTLSLSIRTASENLDVQLKTQEALRISEEKFSKSFHTSPMAILLQRASDRKYIEVNEGFSRITGYTRSEALGKTPAELNIYPDHERLQEMAHVFQKNGFLRDFEIPFLRKDGELGYGLVWADKMEIGGEEVFLAGTIDITERKQAELLQTQQAHEIAILYEALSEITAAPKQMSVLAKRIASIVVHKFGAYECGVWIVSDDRSQVIRKAYCGPELLEEEDNIHMSVTGLVTAAIRNKENIYAPDVQQETSYFKVDEHTRTEFVVPLIAQEDEVLGVINLESPKIDDIRQETRRLVIAFAKNAALAIQNARLVASLGKALSDLAELTQELEQRVDRRTADLQVVNNELEAFSYSVSHDLQSPLRAIRGFGDILLTDYSEQIPAEAAGYLARMVHAASQMSERINGLLLLSRLAKSEINWQPVNLSQVANEILDTMQAVDPHRGITWRVAADMLAQGDPVLLRTALENLLQNAWKYSSKNPAAHIDFGWKILSGKTVYYVQDNGVGFSMDAAPQLFRAFQRLHPPTEFPGYGLGLASVQRIIQRHKGTIWADGEVEKGAIFYFTLG